jgi:hypothetical protein
MPLKLFWMMHKSIDRLTAEEDMRLAMTLISSESGEGFSSLMENLRKQMGKVVVIDEVKTALLEKHDRAGMLSIAALGKGACLGKALKSVN